MEPFSCLLKKAREGGFLLGFRVMGKGGEGVELFRLLFVDDTLVFCKASQKVGDLSSTSLGAPLRAPFKSMAAWDGVEEKLIKDWHCRKDNISSRREDSL